MFSVDVSSTGTPPREARRAAETFDAMPPVPSLPPSPAMTPLRSLPLHTSGTNCAPGSEGLRSNRPSTSDSSTSASQNARCDTSAARRSLSPKRISDVATVSFSLTIGMAWSWRRRSMVRWALRARGRSPASADVSSTCPVVRPKRANERDHSWARRTWPTAAAACLVARSVGRVDRPSGPMPEATAPEDTRIRSLPLAMRFSSASAISSIFAGSVRPSGPVREDDPIFTTILFASRMLSRVELE